jgi:virulence factor Mce-like protein
VNRRGAASIAANPVLIGAATTLVIVVAVFLAYNANNGLPFVPTYDLKTVVPNAANLVKGNEVRIGGSRVGVVDGIRAVRRPDGSTVAELSMKLETTVQPLPVDSAVIVRPRSALGLKYVEITKGTSARGFDTGETIPVRNAQPEPVELDEFLAMFDEPTRAASRVNLNEFGTALAGRGASINSVLGVLPGFLPQLQTTMRSLSDPETDLEGLFRGLGQAAAETAPVADEQSALFRNLDTTLGALADVREGLQESISTGPPALDAAIESFPRQRPFLANSAALFRELRPGVASLRAAAPDLSQAFAVGRPVLGRSVAFNRRLAPTFQALQRFAEDPRSTLGIRGLRTTSEILAPTLAYVTPTQTVCNYVTLFFRNAASLLSEGDANGTWQRFIIVAAPDGPNNEGSPASEPANGPGPQTPAADREQNFLHANPYPNAAAPGQPRECEAGNEDYLAGRKVVGNPAGNQGARTGETRLRRSPRTGLPIQPGQVEREAELAPLPAGGAG